MHTYTITAENSAFWMRLAVTAASQADAEAAFDAQIAAINEANEEFSMVDFNVNPNVSPEDFDYAYDNRHVVVGADEDGPLNQVRILTSGGNG